MAEPTDDEVKEPVVEQDEANPDLEEEEDIEADPPLRQSSTINAQRRIIEKQRKQLAAKDEGEEDEERLTPNAEKLIEQKLNPFIDALKKQSDRLELREYLAEHPEHKKFAKAAIKRMEAWPNTPVVSIFRDLTYGQTEVPESRKSELKDKAKKNSLPGSTARAQETDNLPKTQEDFKKAYDKVRRTRETIKLGE